MSGVRVALLQPLKDDGEFTHAGIITGFRRRKEAKNVALPVSSPMGNIEPLLGAHATQVVDRAAQAAGSRFYRMVTPMQP